MDDSGTRNPDRKPSDARARDWFALGGILIKEEDEDEIRALHAKFCKEWNIRYPLHSSDIRIKKNQFGWLATLTPSDQNRFMFDLTEMIISIPAFGHACVVNRIGYDARYREKYGRGTWNLCKTAFSVVCERAAKYALMEGRRLRVYPERCDKTADTRIRGYYHELRTSGMPFSSDTSSKYGPLPANDLATTLYDLKFKTKLSEIAQLADLYLYPLALGGYDKQYYPYRVLTNNKKTIDSLFLADQVSAMGIKYSCFD